ncbi:MAG: Hsp33 family molecular chaperone HslO [Woeseiaceae bacterium]
MQTHTDAVVPFVFESLPVRGALIQLQKSWQRMQLGHTYQMSVLETLGHAAAATGLIAQSLKFDGTITMQLTGDGPLAVLVMQCTSELELRGMASAPDLTNNASFVELVAQARCAITVDAGAMELPYQGIVEVTGASLANSLENYYAKSAQIPSHIQLVCEPSICGGILLQQMPDKGRPLEDDWRRLGMLAATLRPADIAAGVGIDLLGKLFDEDDVRIFRPRAARFKCRCSKERAEEVLRMLGEEEINAACAEKDRVDVTCEYCGRTRSFDAVDVSRLFSDHVVDGTDRLH